MFTPRFRIKGFKAYNHKFMNINSSKYDKLFAHSKKHRTLSQSNQQTLCVDAQPNREIFLGETNSKEMTQEEVPKEKK